MRKSALGAMSKKDNPRYGGAMQVSVRLFAAAKAAAGVDHTTVQARTLAEVDQKLREQFPDLAAVLPRCSFLLNETAVHGDMQTITVTDGDTIDVLPPFAGG